ncbi:hypothetical protein TNCV_2274201 [Trichonephila clavipes]|nr:hypothetical protein TNCV_2274201 [Trichonephila clavipes]
MYLREKKSEFRLKWIPVSKGKKNTSSVLRWKTAVRSASSVKLPIRSFGECLQNMLGTVETRWYPREENRFWSDPEDYDERGKLSRGSHTILFLDAIRRRATSCSTNHFQMLCESET